MCAKGLVRGVPPGGHANVTKNGKYAVVIVSALKENPELASVAKKELWKRVAPDVRQNGPVEVVLALWENDLIA